MALDGAGHLIDWFVFDGMIKCVDVMQPVHSFAGLSYGVGLKPVYLIGYVLRFVASLCTMFSGRGQ